MTHPMSAEPLPGFVPWPPEVAERYRSLGLWQGQSIGDWFSARARQHAERPALVDGAKCVTYAQLSEWVDRFAQNLIARGAQPRQRMLVQLPNSLELVVTLLGASRAGVIPVLALPQHRQLELRAFVERATPRFAVLSSSLAGSNGFAAARGLLEHSSLRTIFVHPRAPAADPNPEATPQLQAFSSLLQPTADVVLPQIEGSEVGLLQLSGGSTGVPKLIARTHDDYLYSVRQSALVCELDERSRYLAVLPMTHNFTLSSPGLLGVLERGGCIVNCPNPSPNVVFGLLGAQGITLTSAVPSLVLAWVEAVEQRPALRSAGTLRFLLQVGGAKLSADLAERAERVLDCELQQVFGMAEGLVNYTRRDADEHTRRHTQGRPMSEHDELRVMDPAAPEGTPLHLGATGELQTRGPYTIRGYYDNPEANAQSFTRDGFYRTFDLVRLTATGDVVVEGRIGDRILRAGEKIAPEEVERELRAHPLVVEVAVVGLPDPVLGQRSCAFVVTRDNAPLSLSELRAFLRNAGLAEFKLPDSIQLCSDLPRTAVGKTDRSRLRRTGAEGVNQSAPIAISRSET